ncbi:MAG TPA: peptidylprolyl isomerase [Xanthobacteraceae bacterium]|jgi:peptidyl-prolyl cis-trans isomerase C|nr:peptidylprolyl isomerase [Xanthobacteraceae bacterium]
MSFSSRFVPALAAACLVSFLLAGSAALAQAPAPDPVVAKVNGVEIRQSDLAIAEEEIGASLPPNITPEAKREYLTTYLIDMILVAQDAEIQGMSATDEFKRRFQMARNKVLMELDLRQLAQKAVTEDAMRKVYDEAVKQMAQEEEVRARHVLVEKEEDAKAIAAEAKGGADFAELAKKKSIEPGAAESGGDLGYFTKDQMVPEFAEAAFKLDKGKISDPVKSQFGWHVIKSEDKRKKPVPTFDQVKDQLQTFVVRKAQSDLVTKLRTSAKIERTNPPAPAAATPAPAAPAAPGAPAKK